MKINKQQLVEIKVNGKSMEMEEFIHVSRMQGKNDGITKEISQRIGLSCRS